MDTKVKTIGRVFAVLLSAAALLAPLQALPLPSHAEAAEAEASLFLPSSFEQYLELASPSDAAFSEGHIAIADGSVLHVYDRKTAAYTELQASQGRTITHVGFAGERLFVSDNGAEGNYIYEYSFLNNSLVRLGFNCSAFCIDGGTLYTATSSSETHLGAYDIASLSEDASPRDLGIIRENKTPSMTVSGGVLYCAFNDRVYYPDGEGWKSFLLREDGENADVSSVCAHGGALYFTTPDGICRTDFSAEDGTLILEKKDYFRSLASYGGKLYATGGSSVHEIDPSGVFGQYEISAASSSEGRLSGASDSVRAGKLLVTADTENCRISVTVLKGKTEAERTYSIPCINEGGEGYHPHLVATDGNVIAAASDDAVYLYPAEGGDYTYRQATARPAVGLACVYGACYYVTEEGYGKASSEELFVRRASSPRALAADLYGALYVADAEGHATRFTEKEFTDPDAAGTVLPYHLPEDAHALRADLEGSLYCLSGSTIYRNGEPFYTFENARFVHGDADMPRSFALGFEDDSLFVTYGNFLVVTEAAVPTLDKISAAGIPELLFTPHTAEGLFVDIPAGAVGIRTDLSALADSPAYFPYLSHARTEGTRGVLLARTDTLSLVAVYEISTTARTLTAQLFRNADLTPLPESEYWRPEEGYAYLTNDVSAYYFPGLHPALAGERMKRGTRVRVLGYVTAAERDFALIEGENAMGFLPASYLTDITPIPPEIGVHELGYLKANKEGVLFRGEGGEERVVTERTRVDLFRTEEGYVAEFYEDGVRYSASVTENMVDRGESDALRISLIVILTVLAVGIVGVYFFLVPKRDADRPET